MTKTIQLIGKETFNENGFFRTASDSFLKSMELIKKKLPTELSNQKIIMTNMNLFEHSDDSDSIYYPKVVRYEKFDTYLLNFTLNPIQTCCQRMYEYEYGESITKFPQIDFVCFDGNQDSEIFSTYANIHPTLYFETENKMCCIGSFYRLDSLKDNFEYTIKSIFETLNVSSSNTVECVILTCSNTYINLLHSNMLDFIIAKLKNISHISSIFTKWIIENEPNCYKKGEHGNHVIVVY